MSESLLSVTTDTRTSQTKEAEKDLDQKAKEEAQKIAEAGQTFDYIFGIWQKRHHGDAALGKALLFSLGSQSVSNCKGIHVAVTGEGGYGKSDGIKKMGNLIHPDYWKNGGFTPQSLYYSGENMSDGIVIGLEDIEWNSDLGISIKRITTDFQEGATRVTTIDMAGKEVRTAKRIAFWASCVDSQADEQIRDRFIMYNVKSDSERCNEIIRHMQTMDGSEFLPDNDEFETKVCQTLTFDLKKKVFRVKVPFAGRIMFNGGPRAYEMFSAMIKASTAFNYRKRERDEFGNPIAAMEDFENAKSLYIEMGGHDRDKYTDAELNVLIAIGNNGGEATQSDIQRLTQLSSGRVSDIINGRGKEGHGLLYKCKELSVVEGRPKKYKLEAGFSPVGNVSIWIEEPTYST